MFLKRKAKRIQAKHGAVQQPEQIRQIGYGNEMPPQKRLVEIYFNQKGFTDQAELFYSFFEQAQWSSPKGTPYRNWKLLATDWIFDYEQSVKLRKRQWENVLL